MRKDYLKVTISVNIGDPSILAMKTTNSRYYDSHVAIQVLRASHRTKAAEVYMMDNPYDSEAIHDFIHNTLKSVVIIPIRHWNGPFVSGIYRYKMAIDFDYDLYHKRNNVETDFSVIKRKFGEKITARKYLTTLKEIELDCIAYHLDLFLHYQRAFNVF